MSFGDLDDGGQASGCWYVVPLAGGGVVECDIAGLSAPLDEKAAPFGLLEPLALALEVPGAQGVLVAGDDLVQLFGDYFSRGGNPQGETPNFERYALVAQIVE
jgi:hypothetical protein